MSSDRDMYVRSDRERASSNRSRSADAYRSIAESEEIETADRIAAAVKLARFDRQAAIGILQGITADSNYDEDERWTAAESLSTVDPQAAAEAFYNIANDDAIYSAMRIQAADRVAELEA